jgi:hypothetical protein
MGNTYKAGDEATINCHGLAKMHGKRVRVVRISPVGTGYTVELLEDVSPEVKAGERLYFAGWELKPLAADATPPPKASKPRVK